VKLNVKYIFLVVVALIFAIVFVPRLFVSEKERIEKTIELIEKAVKSKDSEKVLKHISENYSDTFHSNLGAFEKGLKRLFDNSGPLYIEKSGLKIEVDPDGAGATAFFIAKVSTGFGNNQFDLIEEFAKSDRFLVHLDKSSGEWKVTQVENLPYTYD
jgi:hypothetical protein